MLSQGETASNVSKITPKMHKDQNFAEDGYMKKVGDESYFSDSNLPFKGGRGT